ncbi:Uncharacterised protein [Mycobacteroides abscessus subsp. abscessus]|nr:Uncharacterised protein [Mycobacteroides abscessus subsp. abscessus]
MSKTIVFKMDVVLVSRFSYLFKRIKWYDHTIPPNFVFINTDSMFTFKGNGTVKKDEVHIFFYCL